MCCLYPQEDWDFLQLQCALYINSEMSGIPLSMQVGVGLILYFLLRRFLSFKGSKYISQPFSWVFIN